MFSFVRLGGGNFLKSSQLVLQTIAKDQANRHFIKGFTENATALCQALLSYSFPTIVFIVNGIGVQVVLAAHAVFSIAWIILGFLSSAGLGLLVAQVLARQAVHNPPPRTLSLALQGMPSKSWSAHL